MNWIKRTFGKRYSGITVFNGRDLADIQFQLGMITGHPETYLVRSISTSQYRDNNGSMHFIIAVAYDFFPNKKTKK
jgi:hypothetical protein